MKNAIILHGCPSKQEYYDPATPSESNSHWLPWLQKQLIVKDILAVTPEVPFAFDRNWAVWQKEVERFDMGPDTKLVGHSTGAGFWIKYLSIHPELKVNKVVLVAPWLDPFQEHTKNFFDDFKIDKGLVSRTAGVTVFYSDDDQADILKTVDIVREQVTSIKFKEFHGYKHFCFGDMKTIEFPELLEEVAAKLS
ncbi:MAG TPA: alpha/beta hydrolase [Candidatus Saccharimonadales bacterium]|jgi:predicted alpha/beta hydrolase family esterase|nr:alpha/beta hydrolase [Candidatus Saccharimonadales bacterium]